MKIINVKNIEEKEVSKEPLFFGGKVTTQFVLEEDHKAPKLQVVLVKFAAGARNKLHAHSTVPVTAPVVGTTRVSHVEGAVAALSIELTAEEIAALEEPYEPHPVIGIHV